MGNEGLVQQHTAYSSAAASGEVSSSRALLPNKLDAPEVASFTSRQAEAEAIKHIKTVRHQAFTAGFINRRRGPISNHAAQTLPAHRNCGGQTGWSATYDKYIGFQICVIGFQISSRQRGFTTSTTGVLSRIPAPWRQARCMSPALRGDAKEFLKYYQH